MAIAKKTKTARGRKQHRARVAGGQDYEVQYEAKTTVKSAPVVLQHWTPQAGHYPEIAYQTAFALNLALQVAAWIWFMFPRVRIDSRQKLTREPCSNLGPGRC